MIRVLEGGVGRLRGGRLERSSERPAERERLEEGRDDCGDGSEDIIAMCTVVDFVGEVLLCCLVVVGVVLRVV